MSDKNKRAIVVGASRGIGLGLVRELLNQHWQVIATIRDIDQVSTGLNQLLSEYPDRLELTELDLSYVQTADRLLSKYHEKSIDLLLVSAGILGPEHQRVEQCTPNEIANLFWVMMVIFATTSEIENGFHVASAHLRIWSINLPRIIVQKYILLSAL